MMIRKLSPNVDKQSGLETVLEEPVPEEMYAKMGSNAALQWQNRRALMKAQSAFDKSSTHHHHHHHHLQAKSDNEFLALLKIVGAPLIPFQVHLESYTLSTPLKHCPIGLDPRCTASLFLDAVCTGEQTINDEDSFILKLETASSSLKVQSSAQTEIIHHTIWGYFSQRTGLLVKFEDKKLVMMKPPVGNNDNVFWETSAETAVRDYKYVDGINLTHGGKTVTTLYRYGKSHNHKRKIEETWRIDEVDFNICGLSNETFLPPADLKREQEEH